MKKLFLITLIFLASPVFANYRVQDIDEFSTKNFPTNSKKVLFILDFSNSMNERLHNKRKIELMLATMYEIIPSLGNDISIGLRVYGHKAGITPFDACKASTLITPIAQNNSYQILNSLQKVKPKGMTPITYSLKQAIRHDFVGFKGQKHIILLTDGGENCDESPCTFAMNLVRTRNDITIDVIAFNIKNEDDIAQLRCTSMVTSGKFYSAENTRDLTYSIKKSLENLKTVEAKIIPHY
ncbi:MAG: vWA domain-containing protein [Candidatus Gastranaerophilales bacterium]